MGQGSLHGAGAAAALETAGARRFSVAQAAAAALHAADHRVRGGILDDLMVANLGGERLFLVVNASRKEIDFPHIGAHLPARVRLEQHEDPGHCWHCRDRPRPPVHKARAGTREAAAVAVHGGRRHHASAAPTAWCRAPATPARTVLKYRCPANRANKIRENTLLRQPEVMPAGLGARDSLRLEAGLCACMATTSTKPPIRSRPR